MPRVPRALAPALLLAALWLATAAAPAPAAPVTVVAEPLTIHIGERGQLQAVRTGGGGGMFFPPGSTTGDAGFFLAFPAAATPAPPAAVAGLVFGFNGGGGPAGLQDYAPAGQGAVTGTGLPADPLRQQTVYDVSGVARVTQTTSYFAGAESFTVRWDVTNVTAAPLTFKALAAADFFFRGSDAGTGVFTAGPLRFVGSTNPDTGLSGGFAELPAESQPWSHYEALAFGDGPDEVWGKVQAAAGSTEPTFLDGVLGTPADNAGGVEWDQQLTAPLAPGTTAGFALGMHAGAVSAALRLTPPRAAGPQGVPIAFTATALDAAGAPLAGRTVRFAVLGANPATQQAVADAAGNAVLVDTGAARGNDTVVAFVDLNGDGARDASEPQASALATFTDQAAPTCTVRIAGNRLLGRRERLVVAVRCSERVTLGVRTTLGGRRLATVRAVAAAGRTARLRVGPPKRLRRRYAGRTVTAAAALTVRDAAGNAAAGRAARKVRLAPR